MLTKDITSAKVLVIYDTSSIHLTNKDTFLLILDNLGAGFRVSITTRQLPDLHMISSVMREMSPDAELGDRILRTLVYEISPATDMACLLNRLETCRSKLNIESIRIGTVTMEEVFMK